jgi:hypothetical protein
MCLDSRAPLFTVTCVVARVGVVIRCRCCHAWYGYGSRHTSSVEPSIRYMEQLYIIK